MQIFQYTDRSQIKWPVLVCEIEAEGILEADALLLEFCSINAFKTPLVVCSVIGEFSFEPYEKNSLDNTYASCILRLK